jgi:acyl transferase domain-containing protein/NAD(P)H-dependent flavin oxidoreductase YrpB (nitropropane dioxygenase family)/NAD(P)-dependent dehydrogenase (short-subunit alcohol dehydrogenase family)
VSIYANLGTSKVIDDDGKGQPLLTKATADKLVVVITPFEEPQPRLVVAAIRAGAVAILDLGRDADRAYAALADIRRWTAGSRNIVRFGVRIPPGCPVSPAELDARLASAGVGSGTSALIVDRVVLPQGSPWTTVQAALGGRRVVAEITSSADAIEAARAGAHELIARGAEGGGRVGQQSSFMLLQSLMADPRVELPIWVAGGIGMHSAAAAVAGGAAGVVLDAQLALVSEMDLPGPVSAAIAAMDGSETRVIGAHRLYVRPDLPVAALHERDPPPDPRSVALELGARDLGDQLLPIGQDGAFASAFAARHRTAGGVLQAVHRSIVEHLADALVSQPLAPGARLAAVNGLRHPVAQGPMTRVSDRAAFALSVAEGGGLPFLALALMSAKDVAALLEETAALFAAQGGDLPWGVGILGFVPAELRDAQLEVISDFRPPYALIAGGRPSQAAPLEAAGISTFLHVPTPTLMEQFIAAGARKFVVEGRECGGHVGPRSSFPLWDAQVDQLLACIDQSPALAAEVQLLFAGGVHDERSAAMVAALAAPLAARDVAVGVLMGTAYLFTEEAVTGGAVVPNFQQEMVDCERTVLLETSPGHATRCVDSPFVRFFEDAKRTLVAGGASRNEMWASLEELNLGRLRIASKGLRRTGARVHDVDELEQRDQGMFMTGEVATLRHAVTTVDALHAQVTAGGVAHLADRAERIGISSADGSGFGREAGSRDAEPLDIAVVGMACVFPQAEDLATYWANIVGGVDSITEVSPDRWNHELYYDPDHDPLHPKPDADVRTPSKSGGFLPPIPFDALSFGIPPSSLTGIETVQLLALDVAAKALRDAGYGERPFDRSQVSVFFGAESGNDLSGAYGLRSLYPGIGGQLPPALDAFLPRMTEDSFPGVLGNVIAGRIANRLDLGGSNYTVDAACASSLAALDAACKDLRAGTSSMVLCGGADLHNGIHDYLLFASVHALSPTGRCRSFDATADGIALGEGVGCVALKRLADAERDGDRIYAVIKGVGGASDGRSLGLTAPRAEGQRRAMERSYAMAGVSPAQVGLLEAHGTGTVVGDRTELSALTDLFTDAAAPSGNCALGSVKSQIGHTKCAAGIAGLIKASLALHTGVRPPTINLTRPGDGWDAATSPFRFDQKATVWPDPPTERFAAVSAFGFGGTNFHAVLGAYDGAPGPSQTLEQWPAELFLFHGADRDQAGREVDRLASLVAANNAAGRPWRLRDLALTLSVRPGPVHLALVADDLDDLETKLEEAESELAGDARAPRRGIYVGDGASDPGPVAFVFPGQGSQRPGMLADLFVSFPEIRSHLEAGRQWLGAMLPPAAFTAEERAVQLAAITDTRVAQPTLGMADAALCDLLASVGVRPGMAAGHSYGELVALCAAGVFDDATLLDLSEARARAILEATEGTDGAMAAVRADADAVRSALASAQPELAVVIANHNAPDQVVLSGAATDVEEAVRHLVGAGLTAKRIPVACAFHSPLVAGADTTLLAYLDGIDIQAPTVPVWSNTTAAPYPADPAEIRSTLAGQVVMPVRWVDQIEAMYDAGARVFVEVGPGRTLSQLVGKILGPRPHTAIPCDVPGESGVRRLLMALAELSVRGVPVDAAPLFHGRDACAVDESSVPRRAGWTIDGSLVRGADGDVLDGGLQPAPRGPLVSLGAGGVSELAATNGDRDATVLEFLRTTRELVAAQRDVVLGYLGAPIPAAAQTGLYTIVDATTPGPDTHALTVVPAAAEPAITHAAPQALTPEQLSSLLLEIVSQRTGYPLDMLDVAADLEADLSIDSIKRTEILGEVAGRAGLTGDGAGASGELDPRAIEELAALKTIEAIVDWITEKTNASDSPAESQLQLTDGSPPPGDPPMSGSVDGAGAVGALGPPANGRLHPADVLASADPGLNGASADLGLNGASADPGLNGASAGLGLNGAAGPTGGLGLNGATDSAAGLRPAEQSPNGKADHVVSGRPDRFVVTVDQADLLAPVENANMLDGHRFVVVPDARGIAPIVAGLLEECGADVEELASGATLVGDERIDGIVHLAALDPGRPAVLPGAYEPLRAALLRGAARVMIVTGQGGMLGHGNQAPTNGGSHLPPGVGLPGLARTLSREFPDVLVRALDVDPEQPLATVARYVLEELLQAADAAGPTVVGRVANGRTSLRVVRAPLTGPDAALELGPESVVIVTGGARGITAKTALGLARASGCHLELIGRTPLPAATEDPRVAGADGAVEIRQVLIEQGMRVPAEIEIQTRRLLAEREIRRNLAAAAELAASVHYHQADIRDAAAVQAAVDDALERHGRLDGVIHGAGVLDDKLVRDKTPESFADVFSAKVAGADALADAVERGLAARGSDGPAFVVFFGSISGVFGNRGQADYSAANDALGTLSRRWASRFAAGQVLCVDWGPWESAAGGMVSTDLKREYERRGIGLIDPDEGVACLLAELAAGQTGSRVREGLSQIVYLCGDLDAYEPVRTETSEAVAPGWVAGGV